MKRLLILSSFSFFLLLSYAHAAEQPLIFLSSKTPLQGDTVMVTFKNKSSLVKSAIFGTQPIQFFNYRTTSRAVIPIAATKKPGTYLLRVRYTDGRVSERTIIVRPHKFPYITLDVPKKLHLSSLALVQKLAEKKQIIAQITSTTAPHALFANPFRFPLNDHSKLGSPFGELRDSGGTLIRHMGADFTAPIGTPVYPINDGVVQEAYLDSLYGNSVVIDHGAGIYSLYLHLNEFRVHSGERVTKEVILGTVGQTGYATAPHLHLSVKLGGVSIDPLRFISVFK